MITALVLALGNRAEQIATPVLAADLAPADQLGRWMGLNRAAFNAGMGIGVVVGSSRAAAGRSGFVVMALAGVWLEHRDQGRWLALGCGLYAVMPLTLLALRNAQGSTTLVGQRWPCSSTAWAN